MMMFEKVWGIIGLGIGYKFKCVHVVLMVYDGCITWIRQFVEVDEINI